MDDFAKAHAIASEVSENKSPRRVRAVNNIVAACGNLIEEKTAITYASVAEKIEALTEENTTLKEEKEILIETLQAIYDNLEEAETALTDLQDDIESR